MEKIDEWNGKFIVLIPELKIYNSDRTEYSIDNIKMEELS